MTTLSSGIQIEFMFKWFHAFVRNNNKEQQRPSQGLNFSAL